MALKLNIPALQDNPVFVAETRPQKILQSLSDIKDEDIISIASHLQNELEILNRQKISPSSRIQALDSYRALLIDTAHSLAKDYTDAMLPLHDKAKTASFAAQSLWLELGYGYKLALIDLQNQLIKIGTDKSSAHAIQRAMHAVAEHALVFHQTYIIPPSHIWSDLHQLYFCAVQLGIHNISIQNDYAASDKSHSNASIQLITTVEDTYKHAMLMSLADPQHLTQQDIKRVAEYLAHHIKLVFISAIAPLENPSGAFVIGLDSDAPPAPYSKQKKEPNPVTDILLQTIDLIFNMHQDLNELQNHQLPRNGSIPADANRNDYIELLTYLIKNWGITPKRLFNRSLKNNEIDLVAGINAVNLIASENKENTAQKNQHHPDALTAVHHAQVMPSRWKTLNISASGVAIRRHHTAEKNISIGMLIAIKTKNDAHWSIGLVRWANCGTRDRLDIGVQLIAPIAYRAMAHSLHGDDPILILPEIAAVKQVSTIIAKRGTFVQSRQLKLIENNQVRHVTLTKLLERTHYIERMQYNIVTSLTAKHT